MDPKVFKKFLLKKGINFFCGVPDSCVFPLVKHIKKKYILANEGTAIAFAAGYYLSTKKLPLVFLQNSGLGNATDPLTNLINKEVYSLLVVLLIGWRGHPKIKDEKQHVVQGKTLLKTLNAYDIKYQELKNKKSLPKISDLIKFSKKKSKTVAILVNKKTFHNMPLKNDFENNYSLNRADVLLEILKQSSKNDKIFSSVGYNSRELYQISEEKKISRKIFYLVGAMGHTAAIALGSNLFDKSKINTICIDGDASFLMHMGSIVNAANLTKKNFKYLVFKNDKHESIGNIDLKLNINFEKFASSAGFKKFILTKNNKDLKKNIKKFLNFKGSVFHVVCVKNRTLDNLLRPKNIKKIKEKFLS